MKNIIRVVHSDFKRVRSNVVAVVVIIGLCLLPCLYAWFNIMSNWDPYGADATKNLSIAVYSCDVGAEVAGKKINIGDTVIESLEANKVMGWVFCDSKEDAIEGVYASDYYAAIIVPVDFTQNMVSFLQGSVTHPSITYYENEKKNAIAPKITAKAQKAVKESVNSAFISTLGEVIFEVTGAFTMGAENTGMVESIIKKLENLDNDLEAYCVLIESMQDTTVNSAELMDLLSTVVPDLDGLTDYGKGSMTTMQGVVNKMAELEIPDLSETTTGNSKVDGKIQEGDNALNNKTGTDASKTAQEKMNEAKASGVTSANKSINDTTKVLNKIDMDYDDLGNSIDTFRTGLDDSSKSLAETAAEARGIQAEVQKLHDDLVDFTKTDEYEKMKRVFTSDPEELKEFLASPVSLVTERIYAVRNYGSAMAPFYTVLALWVGSLILVPVIHVKVNHIPDLADVKPWEAFFGRYVIFFLIAEGQALITCLGDLFYIGIQCTNNFLFWLGCAVSSFAFSFFIYSLTVAFGNIGEAVAVVIMVIQVAGGGGSFPKEVLPEVFQAIYNFLPFAYSMNALRECVAGLYHYDYWLDLLALLILIVISLFIGLVLEIPVRKLMAMIEESKEETEVMI